jgi:hypothetical protein
MTRTSSFIYQGTHRNPLSFNPNETTHLLPKSPVSKRTGWVAVALVIVVFTGTIWESFSGKTIGTEFIIQPQELSKSILYVKPPENTSELPKNESYQENYLDHTSNNSQWVPYVKHPETIYKPPKNESYQENYPDHTSNNSQWVPYVKPPKNINKLPMNESCQEEYLDRSSGNYCVTVPGLCETKFNCPRSAMVHFNMHGTLPGFVSWYGTDAFEFISSAPAKMGKFCQRELFKIEVDYAIDRQKDPIPNKVPPCGDDGRNYLLSDDGCIIDGNHGMKACADLNLTVNVLVIHSTFFRAVEDVKKYLHLCWTRVLSSDICHLRKFFR